MIIYRSCGIYGFADLWEWKPKACGSHSAERCSNSAARLPSLLCRPAEHRADPARRQAESKGCTVSYPGLREVSMHVTRMMMQTDIKLKEIVIVQSY